MALSRKPMTNFFPEATVLLALEPEELAGPLLEYLLHLTQKGDNLNCSNLTHLSNLRDFPPGHQMEIAEAIVEAWVWLEREGLIAPLPGEAGSKWAFITRRGHSLRNTSGIKEYRKANLLPKGILHPTISTKVWITFLRGDYDTAVFQAFKEVEIAVRQAGSFPDEVIGVDLMRKAFKPNFGPLTDTNAPLAEQEALMHLAAGAIGSYKNPHSHRHVTIAAEEAVEMVILASHLLKIVDTRTNKPNRLE